MCCFLSLIKVPAQIHCCISHLILGVLLDILAHSVSRLALLGLLGIDSQVTQIVDSLHQVGLGFVCNSYIDPIRHCLTVVLNHLQLDECKQH